MYIYSNSCEFKGKLAIIWQPKFDPKFINIVELFGYRIIANFVFPFKFHITDKIKGQAIKLSQIEKLGFKMSNVSSLTKAFYYKTYIRPYLVWNAIN